MPAHPRLLLTLLLSMVTPAHANEAPPWDMERLSKAPVVEWVSQEGPVHSLFYAGEPFKGQPTKVFAYYATPATVGALNAEPESDPARYPGIVLIHGGGGTAFKEWVKLWAERGYAAVAMDLAGSRPREDNNKKRTRLPDGGPDQDHTAKFDTLLTEDLSDDWCYHAVANGILAHSLLRTLPHVDADRTAVTGISWGGYTTCIVASVDSRFKAAVPVYGCGFLHENSTWLKEFAKLGPEHAARWVKWYDPSSWLGRCEVPVFWVNGTNDFAYPLDSYMKSMNAVKARQNMRIQVKMPHSHEAGWAPKEIGLFVDHALGVARVANDGEVRAVPPALAYFKAVPQNKDGKVQAEAVSETPLTKAEMHYSQPGEAVNKREWVTVPATIKDGVVSAPAPAEDGDMYFLTVTDERGAMISSPVVIRKKPAAPVVQEEKPAQ